MPGVVPPRWRAAALLAALAFVPGAARATTVRQHLSIIQLLQDSEIIVRGRVASVTDGIDRRGIPYTEVTLQISEALKGQPGRSISFRQFGHINAQAHIGLFTCGARQAYIKEIINFADKSGTINSSYCRTAQSVGCTQETCSHLD